MSAGGRVRYNCGVQKPSTSQVRQWAREQGVQVGERGRLPAELVAQYLAEQGASTPAARAPSRTAARVPAARASNGDVVIGRTVTAKPRWDWKR